MQRVPAQFLAQRQQFAFADPRGSGHGEVVAPPLIGHAYAHPAHANDVADIAVVGLYLDRWKDQRALFIHVARRAHVGGRLRIAAVSLMSFGDDGKAVDSFVVDHRHEQRVVGGMRATVIRGIVQKGVPALQIRVKRLHGLGHKIGS